jgi:four helix bundle protein
MSKKEMLFDKSKKFAIRIFGLYKYLTDEKKEYIFAKQILRSGTSIGANLRESKYAQSGSDFIHKKSIALKEASETEYWLELLHETGFLSEELFISIYNDCNELCKILISNINALKKSALCDK